ncbi:MAG: hypothetical protein AABY32_03900 [Nanoarchaeota archaeon]
MRSILIAFLFIFGLCQYSYSLDDIQVKLGEEFKTNNLFRGLQINDSWTSETALNFQYNWFHAEMFADLDLNSDNNTAGDFTAINLKIYEEIPVYENPCGCIFTEIDIIAGAEHFMYPEHDNYEKSNSPYKFFTEEQTSELFAGFKTESCLGVVSKTIGHFDVNENTGGFYLSSDLERPFLVTNYELFNDYFEFNIIPSIGSGYGNAEHNDYYYQSNDSGSTDWHTGIAFMSESDNVYWGPSITYSSLFDHDIRENNKDDDNWTCKLSVGFKF